MGNSENKGQVYLLKSKLKILEQEREALLKEVTSLSLQVTQKRELLFSVLKSLQSMPPSTRGWNELVVKVKEHLEVSKEWNTFEKHFSYTNAEFRTKLIQKARNLTQMEVKIASAIKLDLSTKEIADLLVISPLTVETHRKRIRTKLKLTKYQNLSSFLDSL